MTVPGTVAAWADLLARHERMPLAVVLQPAIEYARDGFPVSELIAASWQRGEALVGRLPSVGAAAGRPGAAPGPGCAVA